MYINSYKHHIFDKSFNVNHISSVVRRMGVLQKTAVQIFELLKQENIDLYNYLMLNNNFEFIYASSYGEIHAVISEANDILNHSLPVSAISFQHSVLNTTPAYLSIIHKITQGQISLSDGFLSSDLAIYLAYNYIKFNRTYNVIILTGQEHISKTNITAECELLILGADNISASKQITEVIYTNLLNTEQNAVIYTEKDVPISPLFVQNILENNMYRYVINQEQQIIKSVWEGI